MIVMSRALLAVTQERYSSGLKVAIARSTPMYKMVKSDPMEEATHSDPVSLQHSPRDFDGALTKLIKKLLWKMIWPMPQSESAKQALPMNTFVADWRRILKCAMAYIVNGFTMRTAMLSRINMLDSGQYVLKPTMYKLSWFSLSSLDLFMAEQ